MKRREMNSLARSICAYLCSRNNDIAGYWGIGMLCAASKRERRRKFSFKIYPGQLLRIHGCEISNSKVMTDELVKHGLDSIKGRISFLPPYDFVWVSWSESDLTEKTSRRVGKGKEAWLERAEGKMSGDSTGAPRSP
jgi:hypothetical protein